MPERAYPTIAEAIEIHRQLVEEFGGSHGLRDQGRLEAAIFRPLSGYYSDLSEEAAALMGSLVNNHAFVDGNKRTSFAVTDTFLRLNGFYLEVEPLGAHKFITEAIGRGEFRIAAIRNWIRANLRQVS